MGAPEQEAVTGVEVLARDALLAVGDHVVVAPDAPSGRDPRAAVGEAGGEVGHERPAGEDVGVDQAVPGAVVALVEDGVERDAVGLHGLGHDQDLLDPVRVTGHEALHHRDLLRWAAVHDEPEPGRRVGELAGHEVAQVGEDLAGPHDVEDEVVLGGDGRDGGALTARTPRSRSGPGGCWYAGGSFRYRSRKPSSSSPLRAQSNDRT